MTREHSAPPPEHATLEGQHPGQPTGSSSAQPRKSLKPQWITLGIVGGVALLAMIVILALRVFGGVGGSSAGLAPQNSAIFLDDRYSGGAKLIDVPFAQNEIRVLGDRSDGTEVIAFGRTLNHAEAMQARELPNHTVFGAYAAYIGTLFKVDATSHAVTIFGGTTVFDACASLSSERTVYCVAKFPLANNDSHDVTHALVSVDLDSGDITKIDDLIDAVDISTSGRLDSYGSTEDGVELLRYAVSADDERDLLLGVQAESVTWKDELPTGGNEEFSHCSLVDGARTLACLKSESTAAEAIVAIDPASGDRQGEYEYSNVVTIAEDGFAYRSDTSADTHELLSFNYQGEELSRDDIFDENVQSSPPLIPQATGPWGSGAIYTLDALQYGEEDTYYVVNAHGDVIAQSSSRDPENDTWSFKAAGSDQPLLTGWVAHPSHSGEVLLSQDQRTGPTRFTLIHTQSGAELMTMQNNATEMTRVENGYIVHLSLEGAGVYIPSGEN